MNCHRRPRGERKSRRMCQTCGGRSRGRKLDLKENAQKEKHGSMGKKNVTGAMDEKRRGEWTKPRAPRSRGWGNQKGGRQKMKHTQEGKPRDPVQKRFLVGTGGGRVQKIGRQTSVHVKGKGGHGARENPLAMRGSKN